MGCVYVARNVVNGKGYTGFTFDLEHRKTTHRKDAENGSMLAFHCAIRKYGWDAFEWSVVYEDDDNDREWMGWWESKFIRELGTKVPNGYNMTDGGDGGDASSGLTRSEEEKQQIREKLLGHSVSEETRRKLSEAHLGVPNYKLRGRNHSDEAKRKMSAFRLGKTYEEIYGPEKAAELKLRKSIERTGKKLSAEARKNMSIAQSKRAEEIRAQAYKRKDTLTGRFKKEDENGQTDPV